MFQGSSSLVAALNVGRQELGGTRRDGGRPPTFSLIAARVHVPLLLKPINLLDEARGPAPRPTAGQDQ